MRTFAAAVCVSLVAFTYAMSAEISAVITKVDADKGTVEFKENKGMKMFGDSQSATVVKDFVLKKGKFDKKAKKTEELEAIEGGLKAEVFAKIGDAGVGCRIFTADEDGKDVKKGQITKILITGGKKAAN